MFKFTTVPCFTSNKIIFHIQLLESAPIKWFKAEKIQLKVTKLKSQYFH